MRHVWRLFLVAFVAACAAPPDLHLDRSGHRIERVDNTLYAFGGFANHANRGTKETFTLQLPDGHWQRGADMTRGRAFFGSAVVDGAVYAIGETIERIDERRVVHEGPVPKSHFATAVVNEKIHILGGYPLETAGHHVFDPATGALERAPPPPGYTPSDHFHLMVALGEGLHVVGGLDGETFTPRDTHHAFDGKTWTTRAKPPTALWAKFAAVASIETTLYVFSMEGSFAYDARLDRWREVAKIPVTLVMPATVVLDGKIHVVGGDPLDDAAAATHVYDPAADRWD